MTGLKPPIRWESRSVEWSNLAAGLCEEDFPEEERLGGWSREEEHVTSAPRREQEAERTTQQLRRQRPDGLAINWQKRKLYLLEYTRCFDSRPDALEKNDSRKSDRYSSLLRKILECLGNGWTGDTLPFTMGVRGSVQMNVWVSNMERLGLGQGSMDQVLHASVEAAVEALDIVFTARTASLTSSLRADAELQD
jgi:hypothetical protein